MSVSQGPVLHAPCLGRHAPASAASPRHARAVVRQSVFRAEPCAGACSCVGCTHAGVSVMPGSAAPVATSRPTCHAFVGRTGRKCHASLHRRVSPSLLLAALQFSCLGLSLPYLSSPLPSAPSSVSFLPAPLIASHASLFPFSPPPGYSCGRPCNHLLSCGVHRCAEICHRPPVGSHFRVWTLCLTSSHRLLPITRSPPLPLGPVHYDPRPCPPCRPASAPHARRARRLSCAARAGRTSCPTCLGDAHAPPVRTPSLRAAACAAMRYPVATHARRR